LRSAISDQGCRCHDHGPPRAVGDGDLEKLTVGEWDLLSVGIGVRARQSASEIGWILFAKSVVEKKGKPVVLSD
jgi:hypothetical protein